METVCSAPYGLFHYKIFLKFSTNSLLMRPFEHLAANLYIHFYGVFLMRNVITVM